ncbi:hypothetical protein PLICRDRAFT_178023 [Plicaturopsis crispa FD-325 SS-3]|nr:hypothetical protein PLICRDRAFT_178023 [Plicaturopsis crispa FD-325 SS-3]
MPKVTEGPINRMNYFAPSTSGNTASMSTQVSVESRWRRSNVTAGSTIMRTAALRQYRLHKSDLEGLEYREEIRVVPGVGEDERGSTYLYSERDVELTAWRRHGGPKAFDAYLNKLRKRHRDKENKNRGPSRLFEQPCSYTKEHNISPWHTCSGAPSDKRLRDLWAATPGLRQLKTAFAPWMWEACNSALKNVPDSPSYSSIDRHAALSLVASHLGHYPPRPAALLRSSVSLDAFRAVLDRAPSSLGNPDEEPPSGIACYRRDGKDIVCLWDGLYLEELFRALVDVIGEHGVEDAGWRSARWEVYDKLATCIPDRGILYSQNGEHGRISACWYDDARVWLFGRLKPGSASCLLRGDTQCEAGAEYNALLPELPDAAA